MPNQVKPTTEKVQGTVSVACASRNEAIERLKEFFKLSCDPKETAKLIRKAVFTIQELQLIAKNEPVTYDGSIYGAIFILNDLAETIDPYFTQS